MDNDQVVAGNEELVVTGEAQGTAEAEAPVAPKRAVRTRRKAPVAKVNAAEAAEAVAEAAALADAAGSDEPVRGRRKPANVEAAGLNC